MSYYRFMEIADLYDEYIKQLDYSHLDSSYECVHRYVLNDCYSESDYIHKYLKTDYNIETCHIYYNFHPLQAMWDKNEDKDPFSILLRQIDEFQPDVIMVLNLWFFDSERLRQIKKRLNKKVHFICYHFTWVDENVKKVLPEYDIVFTGSLYYVDILKKYNSNVYLLRHAFEPSILDRVKNCTKKNKIGFIGSIMIGTTGHTNRIDLFSELRKYEIDFDYYGKVYGSFWKPKSLLDHVLHEPDKLLTRINTQSYLRRICKPSKFGLEYYEAINSYSINLNIHAKLAGTGAGNQRMFEVTGMGSCLMTDYRDENKDLFVEDKEIVVFKDYRELVEKANYLLNNPSIAREIAENGQKRTLKDYTYRNKAHIIHNHILGIL